MSEQIDFFEVEFVKLNSTSQQFYFCPMTLSPLFELLPNSFRNPFVLLSQTTVTTVL